MKHLKNNDSIVLDGYDELEFSKQHTPQIIDILENFEFPENKQNIKNYLIRTLVREKIKASMQITL